MPKPIKRHIGLQNLSREHHHGLLLSWKIRKGFDQKIEPGRIKTYSDWFYLKFLVPHFLLEEKHIFPILGDDHKMVKRALREHRRLKRLFNAKENVEKNLLLIEEELVGHIRFEERVLFNEIQTVADEIQLLEIQNIHQDKTEENPDNWPDQFWVI